MRLTQLIAAVTFLAAAGTAHASPFFGNNQIDDFGVPQENGQSTAVEVPKHVIANHASPIPSNFVDDFGVEVPDTAATTPPQAVAKGPFFRANNVDDFIAPAPAPEPATAVSATRCDATHQC